MFLLDNFDSPSGREQGTNRPVWRVKDKQGRVYWAFVSRRAGRFHFVGYPTGPIEAVGPRADPGGGLVIGAGVGAILGTAVGGPVGAILGGMLGGLLGAASGSRSSS